MDDRVLIPRSPIGELIEKHFRTWVKNPVEAILIFVPAVPALASPIAHYFPEAIVDCVDISEDALDVAERSNLQAHGRAGESDIFRP